MHTDPRYLAATNHSAIALVHAVLRSLHVPDVAAVQIKPGGFPILEAITAREVRYLAPYAVQDDHPFCVRLLALHRIRARATVISIYPDGRGRRGVNQVVFWGMSGPQARWSRDQVLEGSHPPPWLDAAPSPPAVWRLSDGEPWHPLPIASITG